MVVPPGRDLASKPTEPPRDVRAGRRAVLLSVGNWVARKGLLDLLEAVSRLPDDAATLHLAGEIDVEPSYSARVRARLAAPDLARRVVVHGPLAAHQVAALYEAAEGACLCWRACVSRTERVYGEAMAAGLPVVGYRVGNLSQLGRGWRGGVRRVPSGTSLPSRPRCTGWSTIRTCAPIWAKRRRGGRRRSRRGATAQSDCSPS